MFWLLLTGWTFVAIVFWNDGWWCLPWILIWCLHTTRHIQRRASRRDNLDRFYLFQTRWFGVYLHHLKAGEKPDVYHTHPWSWFSIVFGRYQDHRPAEVDPGELMFMGPAEHTKNVRWFNSCPTATPHRVTLPNGPVWTLCFRWRKKSLWWVQNNLGKVLEVGPWTGTENPERTSYT